MQRKETWTTADATQCQKYVEQLIIETEATHDSEKSLLEEEFEASLLEAEANQNEGAPYVEDGSVVSPPQTGRGPQSPHSQKAAADGLETVHSLERRELEMLVNAVKSRDSIGLVSLTNAFWRGKKAALRKNWELERDQPTEAFVRQQLFKLREAHDEEEDPVLQQWQEKHIDAIHKRSYYAMCQLAEELHEEMQRRRREVLKGPAERTGSPCRHDALGGHNELPMKLLLEAQLVNSAEGNEDRANFDSTIMAHLEHSNRIFNNTQERLNEFSAEFGQYLVEAANGGGGRGGGGGLTRSKSALPDHVSPASFPVLYTVGPHETVDSVAGRFGVSTNAVRPSEEQLFLPPQLAPTPPSLKSPVGASTSPSAGGDVEENTFRFPAENDMPFGAPGTVEVLVSCPGMTDCVSSLLNRMQLLQNYTIPNGQDAVAGCAKAVWDADIEAIGGAQRGVATEESEAKIKKSKEVLKQAEEDLVLMEETLECCASHLESLQQGNWPSVSYMLEAKHVEALEGLGRNHRVVYTCREVPEGQSIEQFAEEYKVPLADVLSFTDRETGVRYAYVPTLVSRISALSMDQQLREEIAKEAKNAAVQAKKNGGVVSSPPKTELHEQLAALRRGDTATLSNMLSNLRNASKASNLLEEKNAMLKEHKIQEAAAAAVIEEKIKQCDDQSERLAQALAKIDQTQQDYEELAGEHQTLINSRDPTAASKQMKLEREEAAQERAQLEEKIAAITEERDDQKRKVSSLETRARLDTRATEKAQADAEKLSLQVKERTKDLEDLHRQFEQASPESQRVELASAKEQIAALEDQLRQNARVIYQSTPIPPGSTAAAVAKGMNVPLEKCFVAEDPNTGGKMLYVPTIVPSGDPGKEDERLQGMIQTLVDEREEKAAAAGLSSSPGGHMTKPELALREQLSALRAGDATALSDLATQRALQLQKIKAMGGGRSRGTDAGDRDSDDDGEDWYQVEILRKKLDALKIELSKSKKREQNWKDMCDSYSEEQKSDNSSSEEERAKADLVKRLAASQALTTNMESEVSRLKGELAEAEKLQNGESGKLKDARDRWAKERDELRQEFDLKTQQQNQHREQVVKQHAKQLKERDDSIKDLKKALEEAMEEDDDEVEVAELEV